MPYIKGENRDQFTFIPLCLDDYIEEDSICRVVRAFVECLDMKTLGFRYAEPKETGRPPYDPASMLMLYLYGYQNQVRSSRRLHAETKRNVEVMWLMEKVTPDDKTICNFRKDNAAALKKVFREFSLWCNRQGLYGKELLGVDGTKIRANNSRKNIHSQKYEEKKLATVEKKIDRYIAMLEKNDTEEQIEAKIPTEAIVNALNRLYEKKEKINVLLERIADNGGNEISTVDPDAHIMHPSGDGRNLDACYNVITAVDEKHKLIADFEVSTCPDEKGILPTLTENVKEIMGVTEISAVADKGFYDGEDIENCETNGTVCYMPKAENGRLAPDPKYSHDKFKYDKENDYYICPEGSILYSRKPRKRKDGKYNRAYTNAAACHKCPCYAQCTTDKRGREIQRVPNQDALDIVDARMRTEDGRTKFRKRKQIVEHPFGTMKYVWGYRNFLCRSVEKVTGEQSLVFLAYNLRRVINIFKENGTNLQEIMA